ncbi:MAG: hypothetical protein V2A34_06430, partial [Lentisphaerota bacterium]
DWDDPDTHGAWWGVATRETWRSHSGTGEGAFNAWTHGTNGGFWQEVTNTLPAGTVWSASAWFWSDAGVESSGQYIYTSKVNEIKIEFYDAGGLIDAVTNQFATPGETWTQVTASKASPAGALWVRFVAAAWDIGWAGWSDGGALQMDDVVLTPTAPMGVKIGATWFPGSDQTSNAVYTLRDGDISNNAVSLVFGSYDAQSGLSRGTSSATTQMNITVEGMVADDVLHYDDTMSSSGSTTNGSVSAWTWSSFSPAEMMSMISAGSNLVTATLYDNDNDRNNDRMSLENVQYGWIKVIDDDTNVPEAVELDLKNNEQMTDGDMFFGLYPMKLVVRDYSGIATASSNDDWAPNYSLINPNGDTVHTEVGWTTIDKHTGSNYWSLIRAAPGVAYEQVMTGLYSFVWSAEDLDNDWDGDRLQTVHSGTILNGTNVFLVIDDDTVNPTTPSNIVLTPTTWTNRNYFALSFDPAEDASGIYEYRVSTNMAEPTAATDGETMVGTLVSNELEQALSNSSFEIGYDELSIPSDPDSTNFWSSFTSPGGYLHFDDGAGAAEGVMACRHILADGTLSDGTPRYTLCAQEVYLSNSNHLKPFITFSGAFKGDMSHVGFAGNRGAGFLKAEGFDVFTNRLWIVQNQYPIDHNGAPLVGVNATDWTNVTITVTNANANTEMIRFLSGISGNGSKLALTGHWDNLSTTVSVSYINSVVYTNAPQGCTTNWVFAVDDDNDRISDRLKGPNTNFVIMLDTTPPDRPAGVTGTHGPDETSEIQLDWSPLADGGGISGNPLSPWKTYKVYYTDDGSSPTNSSPYFDYRDYPSLAGVDTASLMISNMPFGVDYNLAVAGVDSAGNEGPLSAFTNVFLSGFNVTQGVSVATDAIAHVEIAWNAVTNREYDLIYADSLNFNARGLTNSWRLVERGVASRLADTGNVAQGRAHPMNLTNTMRFYRAAAKDRWNVSTRRVASEEVYVLKTIKLYPGRNWVSFPGIPDTNTISSLMGYNMPKVNNYLDAIKASWYQRSASAVATTILWLASGTPPHWMERVGGNDYIADDKRVPIQDGVVIEVPTNLGFGVQSALFVGRVPTNSLSQPIIGNAVNMVSPRVPYRLHPSQMNLV